MRKVFLTIFIFSLISGISIYCDQAKKALFTYPETRKVDQTDEYFGIKVADPYRWMEKEGDEEITRWVDSQNKITFDYLKKIPYRDKIRKRLTELYKYERISYPKKVGNHIFFYKNDGLQNQSVIYIQDGLNGKPEVFLDPNKISDDTTIKVGLSGFSHDHRYIACTVSEAGSDWREIMVKEIKSNQTLNDRIKWVKFSGVSWYKNGFFYGGYEKPGEGEIYTAKNKFQKIYYHTLGTKQEKDIVVYEDKKNPLKSFGATVTENQQYLVLSVRTGTIGNELYVKNLSEKKSPFTPIATGLEHSRYLVGNVGNQFYIMTNKNAPNWKVIKKTLASPDEIQEETVIPEQKHVLKDIDMIGGKLFFATLEDVSTRLYRSDLDGKNIIPMALPGLGNASLHSGKNADDIVFFSFTSFTTPTTVYTHHIKTGETKPFFQPKLNFNPENFTVRQVFYKSTDKTEIPMFLVYKKGLKRDSSNPVYLYAYGGFNISITPRFNTANILLMENGFIFAQANIRGGGEYGERWHRAGMLLKKQNAFDDFIAAAEYLIEQRYSKKEKIAIAGGSNGGLLVGTCTNQRPDLFQVALPAVGVMDMLRFHKFTIGWAWVPEYGSSEKEDHFKNLFNYSPLHNIKSDVPYPAILVTTADHDDRVVPAHSFKYIAALQEKNGKTNPALIRIETRSGHGSSSLSKGIAITTDKIAFTFFNLKVNL